MMVAVMMAGTRFLGGVSLLAGGLLRAGLLGTSVLAAGLFSGLFA